MTDANDDVIIEHLPTRFTQLARQKPKLSRAAALRRGNEAVEKLRDDFDAWLEADLTALLEQMAGIHAARAFGGAAYRSVYGRVQSIRDTAGTFGRPDITEVADNLCELLFRMGEAEIYRESPLKTHADALRMVCRSEAMAGDALEVLLGSLRQLVERFPDPDAALREEMAREDARRAKERAAAGRD